MEWWAKVVSPNGSLNALPIIFRIPTKGKFPLEQTVGGLISAHQQGDPLEMADPSTGDVYWVSDVNLSPDQSHLEFLARK